MKKSFDNRLEAIEWIAENLENESQFEVLLEQLNHSFIYFGTYFLKLGKLDLELEIVEND